MTTLDPSHIPSLSSKPHASRHQAVYPTNPSPLHIPAIPDLRFEQSYLRSIAPYVRIGPAARKLPASDTNGKLDETQQDITVRIERSQEVTIDWAHVGWITTRDQVISPLLQGALWGFASQFIQPLMSILGKKISSIFVSSPDPSRPTRPVIPKIDGQFVERLRAWSKSLAGGVEANIALAK